MLIVGIVQACTLGSLLVEGDEVDATISGFVLHVVLGLHLFVNGHDEFAEKEWIRVLGDLGIVKTMRL